MPVGDYLEVVVPECEYRGRKGRVIQDNGITALVQFGDGNALWFNKEREVKPAKPRKQKQAVAWNADKTKSVVLGKLKEFSVTPSTDWRLHDGEWEVRGWFNRENSFLFGQFASKEEAQGFLELIHAMY